MAVRDVNGSLTDVKAAGVLACYLAASVVAVGVLGSEDLDVDGAEVFQP